MTADDERRRELGGFLRARRNALVRADFDLPPVGNRTVGLRREEIAYRAGVSVTWYTWLEQGRTINPSRQVLDAVADTMRLSVAEHEYVLGLAGYAPTLPTNSTKATPPHLQRFLDAQGDSPAFAVAPDWTITGWNAAYESLYPNVAAVPAEDRNLLLLIFTDPYVRRMLPDWQVTSRHFLAEYRAAAPLGSPLIDRLSVMSGEFRQAWAEHRIERFASRERHFHHPAVGRLVFEHHQLIPSDVPDTHVVVYLPLTEADRAKMRQLRSTTAERFSC